MHSVVLHGYLSRFHDGPIKIIGDTVAEVIEGVTRQLKGFADRRHRIKVVGYETEASLYQRLTDDTEIHIVPQLCGGKSGGFLQILLGVALVGVGLFLGGATLMGGILIKAGALAIIGGLSQMLAPQPEADKGEKSRYLGAPKNTVAIGTRIPILYGRYRWAGHYLSFDINTTDIQGTASDGGSGKGAGK